MLHTGERGSSFLERGSSFLEVLYPEFHALAEHQAVELGSA